MSIKRISACINSFTIIAIVLTAFLLFSLSRSIKEVGEAAENRFYSALLVDELRKSSEELTRQVRIYAVTGAASAEEAYFNVLAVRGGESPRPADAAVAPGQKRVLLDLLKARGITDAEFRLVKEANALSDALVALEIEAMNAVKGVFKDASGEFTIHGEPDRELAMSLVFSEDYYREVQKIMAPMDEFQRRVNARTETQMTGAMAKQNSNIIFSARALVFVLFAALLNLFVSQRVVARPLATITGMLKDIAEGEGDLTRVVDIKANNEFGELAMYFNGTLGKIKGLVQTIREESHRLSHIGGDLSAHIAETSGKISGITARIQTIQGRVINQSASVTQTNAAMEQIAANIGELNGAIEKQNQSVAQSSSAIEEMVANIRSVTDTLVKNAANVTGLTGAAEAGRSSLSEVAADIQEIAKESEGLLEINAVMQNIASQTNLLSMNAAIEAAHAGDAGKGFAVVADEIRKLAENAGQQSKTISAALKKIHKAIGKITGSTDTVLGKFKAIDENVKVVAEQEETIRNAMEEQGAGSKQILEAIGSLKELSETVKRGAEEMRSGSAGIIQESQNMEAATGEISAGMDEISLNANHINVSAASVED
ncbi:MAG: methyl-accepting chemotaxis protein, partial [Spirochaetaceae bacterium]|nr:methyl-accepting chemotaxis protein [Spirochaetaceae bacterium]